MATTTSYDSLINDPLYKQMYQTGLDVLGAYSPEQEALRQEKAWGQTKQQLAERSARAGKTGSSEETDALTTAAKDFNLDWANREQEQKQKAISSTLPVSNYLANAYSTTANVSGVDPYTGQPTASMQQFNTTTELEKWWREQQLALQKLNAQLNLDKFGYQKDVDQANLWGNVLGSVGSAALKNIPWSSVWNTVSSWL